jgi:ATP-dependent DNA helicase PIF1
VRPSEDQESAIARLEMGESLFLTGGAGTGKSETIREFLRRRPRLPVARLASTGAAAQLIGGQTVHSFFRLPPAIHAPGPVTPAASLARALRGARTILIDEISMLRVDVFQAILDRLDACRRGPGPFGGFQLVAVGDFAQLPPVMPESEREVVEHHYGDGAVFAFQSPAWSDLHTAELKTIHRQSADLAFARWLGDLRRGETPDLGLVNARVGAPQADAVKLVATNKAASAINDREMAALPGAFVEIEGRFTAGFSERDMRVPTRLALKPGARVILCANNAQAGYANGSTGRLVRCGRDDKGQPFAHVRLDAGALVNVASHVWEAVSYVGGGAEGFTRQVTGSYRQLPILPGWAITIHRAQGMSIPKVHVDPRGIFEAGQAYVALSRATSLAGLTLAAPLRERDVMIDPRVARFIGGGAMTEPSFP